MATMRLFSPLLWCSKISSNPVLQQNQDSNRVDLRHGKELWESSSSPGNNKISFMKDKRNGAKKSLTRSDLTGVWKWVKINWIKSKHEY